MFYSVSFPFFTLIYLLRGVEITTMLIATGFSFCIVQLFLLMGITFFAGVNSWMSAAVRFVALLICGGGLFFFCGMMLYGLILHQIGIHDDNLDYWRICIISAALFIALPIPLLFLASCQFAPVEANRMWAFRVAATVLLLPSFVICCALTYFHSFFSIIFSFDVTPSFGVWVILTLFPFIFFCFLAMHEREKYGFRVRRNIPRSFLGRLVAFPFYTGDYNALAWLSGWFLLLIAAVPIYERTIVPSLPPYLNMSLKWISPLLAAALLTYGYVSFTLYLWSRFLYRWVDKSWIGMITFALLVTAFAGNYAAVYFTADDIFLAQMLSPFFLFVPNYLALMWGPYYYSGDEWSIQLYFSLGVFAFFLAVNLRETRRMFRMFKREDGRQQTADDRKQEVEERKNEEYFGA